MKRTLLLIPLFFIAFWFFESTTVYETTPEMKEAARQATVDREVPIPPNDFYQDGCSMFPNFLLWHDFRPGCLEHDIAYWAGGTNKERKDADLALREQIRQTGPLGPVFAPLMYYGVRAFGDSFITRTIGAHWGYGWDE